MSGNLRTSKAAIIRAMENQVVRCTLNNGYAVEDLDKMRKALEELAASRGEGLKEEKTLFSIGRNIWHKPRIKRIRTGTIEFRSKDYIFHAKDEDTGKVEKGHGDIADMVVPYGATEAKPKFRMYITGSEQDGKAAKYMEYTIIDECRVNTHPAKYRTEGHDLLEYSSAQKAYVHVMTDHRYTGKKLIEVYESLV